MIRYLVIIAVVWLTACSRDPHLGSTSNVTFPEPKSDYERAIVASRSHFLFDHWPAHARSSVKAVFEQLLVELIAAGKDAPESRKLECFERAVSALNTIHRRDRSVIETSEVEQLVDIGNHIAKAAGLEPQKYGDGEGPLSAGREW